MYNNAKGDFDMKRLIKNLKDRGYKISVAESCTGGLISKLITDAAGASEVFDCAVTTYSNQAKIKLLGVSAETLEKYGAVSVETAREMAAGVKKLSNADIAISVTGIAGPGGGSEKKPVGTVCIGIATDHSCRATTFLFEGNRERVRKSAAKTALNLVYLELGLERPKRKFVLELIKKENNLKNF